MSSKIVVTGMSAVTPLGNTIEKIGNNLKNGRSGIGYINRFDSEGFPVKHGGIIDLRELDEIKYPYEGNLQFKLFYYCLNKLYANFKGCYLPEKTSCIVGTNPNIAALDDVEYLGEKYLKIGKKESYLDSVNDIIHCKALMNMNPSLLLYYAAKDFYVNGVSSCNFGTCAASSQAIGDAYHLLKSMTTDIVICGGISLCLDPIAIARLSRLNALEMTKDNVTENCSPFDKHRAGFTIGEGCILFTLEREEDARKRNAKIFAEIKGYGASMDGFSLTDPHEESLGMRLSKIGRAHV